LTLRTSGKSARPPSSRRTTLRTSGTSLAATECGQGLEEFKRAKHSYLA
jgi:hypothetical protein